MKYLLLIKMKKKYKISDKVTHAVSADATDEKVLKSMGARNFDVGVVSWVRYTVEHNCNSYA